LKRRWTTERWSLGAFLKALPFETSLYPELARPLKLVCFIGDSHAFPFPFPSSLLGVKQEAQQKSRLLDTPKESGRDKSHKLKSLTPDLPPFLLNTIHSQDVE
jgi:hypothetical protein